VGEFHSAEGKVLMSTSAAKKKKLYSLSPLWKQSVSIHVVHKQVIKDVAKLYILVYFGRNHERKNE
jgi:hypothetical protein